MDSLSVRPESPLSPELDLLFQRHQDFCIADTPPESMHMMARESLCAPGVEFLLLRDGQRPIGMGAIKDLGDGTVELKSMHVLSEARGLGAAQRIVAALCLAAVQSGARAVFLETGSQASFAPARAFYRRAGFVECAPFAHYREDPNSTFMMRVLA